MGGFDGVDDGDDFGCLWNNPLNQFDFFIGVVGWETVDLFTDINGFLGGVESALPI